MCSLTIPPSVHILRICSVSIECVLLLLFCLPDARLVKAEYILLLHAEYVPLLQKYRMCSLCLKDVDTCVCMYAYWTYVHAYACMHVRILDVCTCLCVYACTHVYLFIFYDKGTHSRAREHIL